MQPYFYIVRHTTGQLYVGVQYGKQSHPDNIWKTYFTSSKEVWRLVEQDGADSFSVLRTKQFQTSEQVRRFERRFLGTMFVRHGREKFCELFINRNLAPGILLQGSALDNLKASLKRAWTNDRRREQHRAAMVTRIKTGFYKQRIGVPIHDDEFKTNQSSRMIQNNPMKNDEIKAKHLERVRDPVKRALQSERQKGKSNLHTKGKKWWNDGIATLMAYECPGPEWKAGRLNPHWNHNRKINET